VSDDRSLRLWVCSQDGEWSQSDVVPGHHSRPIYTVSWSKIHNYIATSGGDSTIKILKEEDNKLINVCEVTLPEGGNEINTVKWCPLENDSFLLAAGGDDSIVRIWRLNIEK
jgi:WD40 repeat protein